MLRKTLFFSASFFCLSLLQGPALATEAFQSHLPQQAANQAGGTFLLAQLDTLTGTKTATKPAAKSTMKSATDSVTRQATDSVSKMAEKAAKGVKKSAADTGKNMMPSGAAKAPARQTKGADTALKTMGGKAKDSLTKGKTAAKGAAAKAEGKTAAKAAKETKAAKTKAEKPEKRVRRKAQPAEGRVMTPTTDEKVRRQQQATYRQSLNNQSCVCVSGTYCVGPRGGHYCYTSGGNKRYLKRN